MGRPEPMAAPELPPLSTLLGLTQSELYRLAAASEPAASGFGPASAPYLWASEFPASVLAALELAPPVLCVAGSGDNPVELLRLGLWPLVAADVSRPACYVNELKAAALRSGLSREGFLKLLPAPRPRLVERLAAGLSPEAARFWRERSSGGGVECASLLDRDPFVPGLAYLATEAAYHDARRLVRPWPLVNLSLEEVLARCRQAWGAIYVSNVAEYIERGLLLGGREEEVTARLAAFFGLAARRLAPGGAVLAYVFAAAPKAARGREAAALRAAGLDVHLHPVEFERRATRFHHCLLEGRKPAKARWMARHGRRAASKNG